LQHFDYNNLRGFSYEQLFQTMRMLRLNYSEAEQMFRRMVFNVMATNYDDHTKNFSFRLKQNGEWELSPAYDICYSYDPNNIWVSQHTLSINGKHNNISTPDLLKIAKDNNIKKAEFIIQEIKEVVSNWKKYAKDVGVSKQLKETIEENLVAKKFEV
jgi:serine/threonine-protein kinase HipA